MTARDLASVVDEVAKHHYTVRGVLTSEPQPAWVDVDPILKHRLRDWVLPTVATTMAIVGGDVETFAHELAHSVAYDEDSAVPYATLVSVSEAWGFGLTPPEVDPYCVACRTSNCGGNCDRQYERGAGK